MKFVLLTLALFVTSTKAWSATPTYEITWANDHLLHASFDSEKFYDCWDWQPGKGCSTRWGLSAAYYGPGKVHFGRNSEWFSPTLSSGWSSWFPSIFPHHPSRDVPGKEINHDIKCFALPWDGVKTKAALSYWDWELGDSSQYYLQDMEPYQWVQHLHRVRHLGDKRGNWEPNWPAVIFHETLTVLVNNAGEVIIEIALTPASISVAVLKAVAAYLSLDIIEQIISSKMPWLLFIDGHYQIRKTTKSYDYLCGVLYRKEFFPDRKWWFGWKDNVVEYNHWVKEEQLYIETTSRNPITREEKVKSATEYFGITEEETPFGDRYGGSVSSGNAGQSLPTPSFKDPPLMRMRIASVHNDHDEDKTNQINTSMGDFWPIYLKSDSTVGWCSIYD